MNTTTLITDYFMTDALGSVRQLTDAQGEITLANAYEPYGVLAQTAGSAQTSYGFTGEFTDPGGMVYLRARYFMPNAGRFLTRDTWMGDYDNPMSLNRWMYVEGNPVNYTDPSGHWRWPNYAHKHHVWVEDHYMGFDLVNRQVEFRIPNDLIKKKTQWLKVDMFNSFSGDVWEIEPWYLADDPLHGQAQALVYVDELTYAASRGLLSGEYANIFPYDWNFVIFSLGRRFDWPGRLVLPYPGFPMIDFVADYHAPGVIAFWIQPNALGLAALAIGIKLALPKGQERLYRRPGWQPAPVPLEMPIPEPAPFPNLVPFPLQYPYIGLSQNWYTENGCFLPILPLLPAEINLDV